MNTTRIIITDQPGHRDEPPKITNPPLTGDWPGHLAFLFLSVTFLENKIKKKAVPYDYELYSTGVPNVRV